VAVLLIALSCELSDFYAIVYTKENVAAKALADQIRPCSTNANSLWTVYWVASRKAKAKHMQPKLMFDAVIAIEFIVKNHPMYS